MASAFIDIRGEKSASISLHDEPIRILVGPEEKPFFIHESTLRERSDFFQAALKKEWTEGQQRIVKLPDDSPDTFDGYAQWLYCDKILSKVKGREGSLNYTYLVRLYGLGEKLMDTKFQNRVIDAIMAATREFLPNGSEELMHFYPTKGAVDLIYKNTPKGSPLRLLLVDLHVLHGDECWIAEDESIANHEFVVDLSRALMKERPFPTSKKEAAELESGAPKSYYLKESKAETK